MEWEYLNSRLQRGSLTRVALPGVLDTSLAFVIDEIVELQPDPSRAVLEALAVVPPGLGISIQMIATLTGDDQDLCRRTADAIVRSSLVVTTANAGYGLSSLAHLWTRDQTAFLGRYREMVARLQPARHELVWAIANKDETLALRIVEQIPAQAFDAGTGIAEFPLLQAAFHGLLAVAVAILDRGADIHSTDLDGASALHYAAQAGRTELAVALVERGLSPFERNDGGKDAVFVGLYHGNVELAAAILDAWWRQPDDPASLDLALQLAIHRSATGVVRRLLSLGAPHDPDLDPSNSPLLVLAIYEGGPAIVEDLLRAGGTDFRRGTLGEALFGASQEGQDNVVASLLALEAPVSWTGDGGPTPLMMAANRGHDRCARLLLEAGAPVHADDEAGWTAMHHASGQHQPSLVTTLLDFGVDPNASGSTQIRPLTIAVGEPPLASITGQGDYGRVGHKVRGLGHADGLGPGRSPNRARPARRGRGSRRHRQRRQDCTSPGSCPVAAGAGF